MGSNRGIEPLDILAVVGFMLGTANYTENVGQSQMQDAINDAVNRIENHLANQGKHLRKQDELIEILKGELDEKNTETTGLHP